MFEHTADIKARNKTITWYLLHLAHVQDLEMKSSTEPMFLGESGDEKYEVYKSKEDDDDEVFQFSIDKLSLLLQFGI